MSERKYSSGILYFSIYGYNNEKIKLPKNEKKADENNENIGFKINTFIYDESKNLPEGLLARYKMFLEVYREIDGGTSPYLYRIFYVCMYMCINMCVVCVFVYICIYMYIYRYKMFYKFKERLIVVGIYVCL
jgi:hypothetical protein